MRKNFGAKPWTYPQPVFIIATYDENGVADAMNAAWGGITDSNIISICLSAEHKTVKNIKKNGEFTISMATAKYVAECDYVGTVSANKIKNKLEKCGLHTTKAQFVNAPLIDELPMALECKLIDYDEDSMIVTAEIINVNADEAVLTNGKIDPDKLQPIVFDPINNAYVVLGKRVGNAFSDGLKFK